MMRLLGEKKIFTDNIEKIVYEAEMARQWIKVLDQKICKLERFKSLTFDEDDLKQLEKKIANNKKMRDTINETGNDYLQEFFKIGNIESELEKQKHLLTKIKLGKLHYLNQDMKQLRQDLEKKIAQLQQDLDMMLYN